jgi:glycosyltransferase involved in cell wall biosynthesis
MLESWGSCGFTLPDPPIGYETSYLTRKPSDNLKVVMVSTADYDEPIEDVIEVAKDLTDVDFYITGDFENSDYHHGVTDNPPSNVHFTGYVREGYFALIDSADVILCLTTEDNTFLSGDNEALWFGKPLITSDWPLLRAYFSRGAIHIDNSIGQIRRSILEMRQNLPVYQAEMQALQDERRQDWWRKANELLDLIVSSQ